MDEIEIDLFSLRPSRSCAQRELPDRVLAGGAQKSARSLTLMEPKDKPFRQSLHYPDSTSLVRDQTRNTRSCDKAKGATNSTHLSIVKRVVVMKTAEAQETRKPQQHGKAHDNKRRLGMVSSLALSLSRTRGTPFIPLRPTPRRLLRQRSFNLVHPQSQAVRPPK